MCILEDGWSVVEGLLKVPVLGEVVRCSGGFRYVRELIDQLDHQFQFAFQVNFKFGRMVAQSVSTCKETLVNRNVRNESLSYLGIFFHGNFVTFNKFHLFWRVISIHDDLVVSESHLMLFNRSDWVQ